MTINTTMEHSYPENVSGMVDFIKYVDVESGGLLVGLLLVMVFTILFISFQRHRNDTINNFVGALSITTMFSVLLLAASLVAMDLVIILMVLTAAVVAARGMQKYQRR